jgi:hypothetical protein
MAVFGGAEDFANNPAGGVEQQEFAGESAGR